MTNCAICLDEMTREQLLKTTSCSHSFHKECFDLFEKSNRRTICF